MPAEIGPLTSMGAYLDKVDRAMEDLAGKSVMQRIWDIDHTVWKEDPQEITNRLGWLNSPKVMQEQISDINAFVDQARKDGFRQCVLMGMGGSSMAPEVFRYTFGVADGYLDLIVLDTTDPDAIRSADAKVDWDHALFLVATKSGGTAETLSLMKHFYNRLEQRNGSGKTGNQFLAVTDPGSKLVTIAYELGFRKTFLNDPNIGGRYSALSFFGLVPAALIGVDLETLLQRAAQTAEASRESSFAGVRFGAAIGELAKIGRDKLTLILSPGIDRFGAWGEQLIAESLGKENVGVLPVDGEVLLDPAGYRDDRLFVYLQVEGETGQDDAVRKLAEAGHPVLHRTMRDAYDLGSEYFTWEVATVITAERLGINPFDQPNVESAKVQARKMLSAYQQSGQLPESKPAVESDRLAVYVEGQPDSAETALPMFLAGVDTPLEIKGVNRLPYVSIHAYLDTNSENENLLRQLQHSIQKKYKVAVSFGYGPRFLHSTGQLHKGDAGLGRFIQITSDPVENLDIPDAPGASKSSASFATLKAAQALGDRQALLDNSRKVIRLHLRSDVPTVLQDLVNSIGE